MPLPMSCPGLQKTTSRPPPPPPPLQTSGPKEESQVAYGCQVAVRLELPLARLQLRDLRQKALAKLCDRAINTLAPSNLHSVWPHQTCILSSRTSGGCQTPVHWVCPPRVWSSTIKRWCLPDNCCCRAFGVYSWGPWPLLTSALPSPGAGTADVSEHGSQTRDRVHRQGCARSRDKTRKRKRFLGGFGPGYC